MRQIDEMLIASLAEKAIASPRRRHHFNLHDDYADPCQRLLNYLCHDSYIRPHRHSAEPREETLIALRGTMGCIVFDDHGNPQGCAPLTVGEHCNAVVIAPNEWHTVVALSEYAVLLETKAGPFNPDAAKEPATWAAGEGTGEASAYLQWLQSMFS